MEEQARSSQEMVLKNEVMKINEAFARVSYDLTPSHASIQSRRVFSLSSKT